MTNSIEFYATDSNPLGASYGEWIVKWWEWLCSNPIKRNPAFDKTGELIYLSQPHVDVLFLCQTIEGVDYDPIRRNMLPSSRLFFMPLINWISIEGEDGKDDSELVSLARSKIDVIDELNITINGEHFSEGLKQYRCLSPFFTLDLPNENIFGLPAGTRRCVSDGFWLFMHINCEELDLSTYSSCSSGITRMKVKYLLN